MDPKKRTLGENKNTRSAWAGKSASYLGPERVLSVSFCPVKALSSRYSVTGRATMLNTPRS
jgi:hypothetical protein